MNGKMMMRIVASAVGVLLCGTLAAGTPGLEAHAFKGVWITDTEMAAQVPRPFKARELKRNQLPPEDKKLCNRHILFRKAFDLGSVKDARVFVTADDYYKLYVNGVFAGQGPAAGMVEHTYYNEIDVTRLLKPGRNVLAVHTYYQGLVNRVWVSGDRRHGLILDLVADGRTVVASGTDFRTARHTGYAIADNDNGWCGRRGTVGYDTQFLERYDAAAPEVGFARPDFDDSGWKGAVQHPLGKDYRLFPQPTPSVVTETIRPASVLALSNGTLRIDFGGVYVGGMVFAAHGPKGAEVVIKCGQELKPDGSVRHKMRCNCNYVEQMILSGGPRDVADPFDYKSFRYAELEVPPGATVDRDSIVFRARHTPFALKAKPNFGDDPIRQRIWNLCVNSFRYGVQEQIMDCMDREKGYYLGDGVYTMYAYCTLTQDWEPARRFFDDFLRTRDIDRGLVTCANCAFMQEIAEYPLMLILFARLYLESTGDVEFIRSRYAALADVLDAYRERYARPDGLLANIDKWCVVEWPDNYRDGYDADVRAGKVCTDVHNAVNAWYVGAVKTMNWVAAKVGRAPYADATRLQDAFDRAFWDSERKVFVDRIGSKHASMPANVYAAFFDLMPASERAAFKANFLKMARVKFPDAVNMFQYMPLFFYLQREGEKDLLVEFIRHPGAWRRMLAEDATRSFEGWGKDTKWNTSLFHLTTASVAVFLTDPPELAADPISGIVRGTGAPGEGYAPVQIGNGELNTTVDWLGGSSHPSICSRGFFLEGRRIIHPKRELFSQGRFDTVVEVDGVRCERPLSWEQRLDIGAGVSMNRNVYQGDVRLEMEAFVPLSNNTFCVRQTFVNEGKVNRRVRGGIAFANPTHERMVGRCVRCDGGFRYVNRTYGFRVVDSVTDVLGGETGADFAAATNGVEATRTFSLQPGARATATWFVVFADTMDADAKAGTPAARATARGRTLRAKGFAKILDENRAAWKAYYDESYVRLPDLDLQRLADMAAYHLRLDVTRWSFPVGIFDSHWQGLYFGFDEMYIFEGLASAGHLALSRREPDFRFSTLDMALQRNRHYWTPGKYGARWYWESPEEMPGGCISEGTVPGFWCDHIFHISSIARCAWLQYLYSDDLDYLAREGYPLVLECARYFRNNWVYEVGKDEAIIGKCTDLERLGPARDRPFLTTCGAIYAMRIAAKAAALLKRDAEEAADFVACAARLEKGLPQRDGRFTGYLGCREDTVGQLGGFYPYPIFPFDHKVQRKAVEAFMAGGAASGNMYPVGKRTCPWYAAKMAATLNEMHEGAAAVAWLKTAAESRGLFGEFWEIHEPGQYDHPWFTTAAGSVLYALNGLLVTDSGDETRLACGVPKEWKDYAFKLPTQRGVTVEMVVKDGKLEKLEFTPRTPGRSHPLTVVLPTGLREPSRFTADIR